MGIRDALLNGPLGFGAGRGPTSSPTAASGSNTLSPGPVDTPMMDGAADSVEAADALRAQFVAAIPLNRMGHPEEIAAAALFLASDEASFVAGAELSVDGGMAQV
jgi:NAD(P)-dependent dehydrogenase (short-subunit alcohol dehydrogenase family)